MPDAKHPEKKKRSRLKRWFLRGFAAGLLVCAPPLGFMIFDGLFSAPERADIIVVPGAALRGERGERLSDALLWRMQTAVRLYHEGHAPLLFLSGGGEGDWDEAQAMRRFALDKGVPETAIVLDSKGDSTRATADNAARLMRERGLTKALAVSQWYHVSRLRMALRQADVETSGSVCEHPYFLTKEPLFVLREIPAFYAYLFKLS